MTIFEKYNSDHIVIFVPNSICFQEFLIPHLVWNIRLQKEIFSHESVDAEVHILFQFGYHEFKAVKYL
jgi:hypothetical protein